jgi:hypothetical protein
MSDVNTKQTVSDDDVAVVVDSVFDNFDVSSGRLTTSKLVAMTIAALPQVRGVSTLVSEFVRRSVKEGKLVGKRGRNGHISREQRLSEK